MKKRIGCWQVMAAYQPPPQPPQPQHPQEPPPQPPQQAYAWWVVTNGPAVNSTSTAAIAMTLRDIVFCLVDMIGRFLYNIVIYKYSYAASNFNEMRPNLPSLVDKR
jgi:hypothetical protein